MHVDEMNGTISFLIIILGADLRKSFISRDRQSLSMVLMLRKPLHINQEKNLTLHNTITLQLTLSKSHKLKKHLMILLTILVNCL